MTARIAVEGGDGPKPRVNGEYIQHPAYRGKIVTIVVGPEEFNKGTLMCAVVTSDEMQLSIPVTRLIADNGLLANTTEFTVQVDNDGNLQAIDARPLDDEFDMCLYNQVVVATHAQFHAETGCVHIMPSAARA